MTLFESALIYYDYGNAHRKEEEKDNGSLF